MGRGWGGGAHFGDGAWWGFTGGGGVMVGWDCPEHLNMDAVVPGAWPSLVLSFCGC